MVTRSTILCAASLAVAAALHGAPANALTARDCSARYQAEKDAGTLNGMKWNDYRKARCGADAAAAPTAAAPAAAAPAATAPATAKLAPAQPTAAPTAAPKLAPAATGNARFPTAVSPKYSTESAGKARMHTCLDQYNANKATNTNGGLEWIEKGGGYYSECNKRLKG